jgi:hypothetical protein
VGIDTLSSRFRAIAVAKWRQILTLNDNPSSISVQASITSVSFSVVHGTALVGEEALEFGFVIFD